MCNFSSTGVRSGRRTRAALDSEKRGHDGGLDACARAEYRGALTEGEWEVVGTAGVPRLRAVILVTAAAVILCASGAAQATAPHSITFVSPSKLNISPDKSKAARATVVVRNNGPTVSAIRFLAVPDDGSVTVVVTSGGSLLPAFTVKQFKLKLTLKNASKTFAGTLVVAAAKTAPGTVSLQFGPKKKVPLWLYFLIFLPLPLGGAFVGLAYLLADKHGCKWKSRMGPANWDFSKSWASNITVVGALLGTILAAGVLPDETAVSKATYAGLNLFFGVLILISPLVYTATQKAVPVHRRTAVTEAQYQGSVRWFVVASGLTLGAVLGELATIFLLFREIRTANSMPEAAIWFLCVLMVIAGLLLVLYGFRTVQAVLESQCSRTRMRKRKHAELQSSGATTKEDGTTIQEAEVEPELPTWSIL
jgi:hypothetical protein